jgi:hypothetical protein
MFCRIVYEITTREGEKFEKVYWGRELEQKEYSLVLELLTKKKQTIVLRYANIKEIKIYQESPVEKEPIIVTKDYKDRTHYSYPYQIREDGNYIIVDQIFGNTFRLKKRNIISMTTYSCIETTNASRYGFVK